MMVVVQIFIISTTGYRWRWWCRFSSARVYVVVVVIFSLIFSTTDYMMAVVVQISSPSARLTI
jgi:hypothetical protein